MKHDLNLIKQILELVAAGSLGDSTAYKISASGIARPKTKVHGHIGLFIEKGLIDGSKALSREGNHVVNGLTQEGHEFLIAIKNGKVRKEIRKTEKELGKEVTLETIIEIVKDLALGFL